jgi:hypothetical protein
MTACLKITDSIFRVQIKLVFWMKSNHFSVSEFNFKTGMLWFYATQKLNFHILCWSSSPAKELSKDLCLKVTGKNTWNPFPEETNACWEQVWGFPRSLQQRKSTIQLKQAVLYPSYVAGLATLFLNNGTRCITYYVNITGTMFL